jgi:hypothetical protein
MAILKHVQMAGGLLNALYVQNRLGIIIISTDLLLGYYIIFIINLNKSNYSNIIKNMMDDYRDAIDENYAAVEEVKERLHTYYI